MWHHTADLGVIESVERWGAALFSRSSRPSVSLCTEALRTPAEAGRINVVTSPLVLTAQRGRERRSTGPSAHLDCSVLQHFETWREKGRGKGEARGVIESQPLELLIRC